MLKPEDPAQQKFPLHSWWRQVDGKEFVVIEYDYNFSGKECAIIGIKVLEKYTAVYKNVNIVKAYNLINEVKWKEITKK
jgi:hypothetical protein